jgi:hypothetical protein
VLHELRKHVSILEREIAELKELEHARKLL